MKDAKDTFSDRERRPLITSEDVNKANFEAGMVEGLKMFLDFPNQQIAAAEMKLRQKQEQSDATGNSTSSD